MTILRLLIFYKKRALRPFGLFNLDVFEMFAKVDIKYDIDKKNGAFFFETFSDYEKFLYMSFYYAYYDTAFVRSFCKYHSDDDIELVKERYIDNCLYVDSFRPNSPVFELKETHHVWFISDRFRSNMYLREKSRTQYHNHVLTYYYMQEFLSNIYGKEVICPTA